MNATAQPASHSKQDMFLFWGCFIALIATAFAFITRTFLVNSPNLWPQEFALDKVQAQVLFGAGIWPFAISIILFSLIIDKIGYRVAMIFSFLCYAAYAFMALKAYGLIHPSSGTLEGAALDAARAEGLKYLTWGSIILGLGNGTVESFINPVVATLFRREKTKWLNILHAGWPGGLFLGGVITIVLGTQVAQDWRILVYVIALPALIYLVMLIRAKFPLNERVAGGASYREMLAEFGVLGALIATFLIVKQLGLEFKWDEWVVWTLIIAAVVGYGIYCRSLGRPMLILLCLVMMPLATTELGTDGAITGIMEGPLKEAGQNPLWVVVYTAVIMMVLRFFAGPIVHKLSPLGLLAVSSALALLGLLALSRAYGLFFIFAAATLYGVGKTFFWPTMLGVVSEQFPKGGALTLNAIAGIGMLTVGIIGGPLIGAMQEKSVQNSIQKELPGVYETISTENTYFLGEYSGVDEAKVATLPEEQKTEVNDLSAVAKQRSLAKVTIFPLIMLLVYLGLIFYFKTKGGYKAEVLAGHAAEDAKFTGGLPGPGEA